MSVMRTAHRASVQTCGRPFTWVHLRSVTTAIDEADLGDGWGRVGGDGATRGVFVIEVARRSGSIFSVWGVTVAMSATAIGFAARSKAAKASFTSRRSRA